MRIKINRAKSAPAADQIAGVEKALGLKLPSDYLDFLAKYNGGEPDTNIFEIPGAKNESGINEFVEIKRLVREYELAGFKNLDGVVPIAFAEGGNYICLATKGKNIGAIYFWDHEISDDTNALIKVANSISEFLGLLKPFNASEVKLKPSQVKSAWIDPKLLDD